MEAREQKQNEVRFEDIQPDDLMAIVQYFRVEKTNPHGEKGQPQLGVRSVDAPPGEGEFQVIGRSLIEGSMSADRFSSTKRATKTQMAEILTTSWNRPFSVVFKKANGSLRTLRGRLIQPEPLLGRSMVEDLDKRGKGDSGMRLVDHRTIEQLTVGGVQYMLKK